MPAHDTNLAKFGPTALNRIAWGRRVPDRIITKRPGSDSILSTNSLLGIRATCGFAVAPATIEPFEALFVQSFAFRLLRTTELAGAAAGITATTLIVE